MGMGSVCSGREEDTRTTGGVTVPLVDELRTSSLIRSIRSTSSDPESGK